MTQVSVSASQQISDKTVSLEMLMTALKQLRAEQLRDVWQYIQFLDYQAVLEGDSEDHALWTAVQVHEAYKKQNPEEEPEVYQTKEALASALADL